MRSREALFLLLSLSLVPSSRAQAVSTAGLVGVLSVCGGTAIIVVIVWAVICYQLYRTERDFCQFKKGLRRIRNHHRQYRERLLQTEQQMARRSRPRQSTHRSATLVSSLVRDALVQGNEGAQLPQASTDEQNAPLPASRNTDGAAKNNVLTSSSRGTARSNMASERRGYEMRSVRFSEEPAASSAFQRVGETGARNNSHMEQRGKQHHRQHPDPRHTQQQQQQQQGNQEDPSNQHQNSSRAPVGIPRVVLGRYSPKLLREDEEVDVAYDASSSPPRYSWLFPDKRRYSQSQATSNSSTLNRDRTSRAGGERGGVARDMAAYGQLTTWPQPV